MARLPLDRLALRLDGLLAQEECERLIAAAEAIGVDRTGGDYPPSYRDNDRLMVHEPELAAALWSRVRHVMDTVDGWQPVGINPRFRVCRYRDGQAFRIHRDGAWHTEDGCASRLTLQAYLNDASAFTGGATRFFAGRCESEPELAVAPATGMAMLFDHRLWHDGEPVTGGTKYVLRCDVLFRPVETPGPGHRGYVWRVVVGGDGLVYSLGRDRTVQRWEGAHATEVLRVDRSAACLAVGQGIAVGCRDGTLQLPDGRHVQAHDGAVLALEICGDGLVSAGADGWVRWWSWSGDERGSVSAHRGWIWGLSVDGDAVFSVGEDGSLCRSEPGQTRVIERSVAALTAVATRAREVWVGDAAGAVWRLGAAPVQAHEGRVRALVATDAGVISGGEDDRVCRVSMGGDVTRLRRHADFVSGVAVLQDGRVVSSSYDGTVRGLGADVVFET